MLMFLAVAFACLFLESFVDGISFANFFAVFFIISLALNSRVGKSSFGASLSI